MDDMNLFVPITKIDLGMRLVYGVVTAGDFQPDLKTRCHAERVILFAVSVNSGRGA